MKPPPATAAPRRPAARADVMRDVGTALTHSLELVVAMAVGVGLGWQFDRWFPSIAPWGLVSGSTLGMGAVLRSMWRMIAEADRRAQAAREHRDPAA